MNKDLPKVYPVVIDKDMNNTQDVYYSSNRSSLEKEDNLTLESKINRIFNSPNYIYKKSVIITTKDNQKISEIVIGKTQKNLLTMDNKTISIDNIKDIKPV